MKLTAPVVLFCVLASLSSAFAQIAPRPAPIVPLTQKMIHFYMDSAMGPTQITDQGVEIPLNAVPAGQWLVIKDLIVTAKNSGSVESQVALTVGTTGSGTAVWSHWFSGASKTESHQQSFASGIVVGPGQKVSFADSLGRNSPFAYSFKIYGYLTNQAP